MQDFVFFVVKYFVTYVCTTYAFVKLTNGKLRWWDLLDIPAFIALASVLALIDSSYLLLNTICLFVTTVLFLIIRFRRGFYYTLSAGLMALSMTLYLRFPTYLLTLPVQIVLYYIGNAFIINCIAQICLGIVQFVLVFGLFKIKHLRHGLNFNDRDIYSFLLNLANFICFFATMLINATLVDTNYYELGEFAITFFGFMILFLYRKNSIDNASKQQAVLDREAVELSVEAYGKQLYSLERENELMGKLIHCDNKILPALQRSATATLLKYKDPAVTELLQSVAHYDRERAEDIAKFPVHDEKIPHTGVTLIDSILYNLNVKARAQNVKFEIEIFGDIGGWFTGGNPDRTAINVLLGYLGENALFAAAAAPDGKVKITVGKADAELPCIRVWDNGEHFNEKVIANMGITRVTTRKESGGNGFGLQTLFETVRRYDASFTLDEICAETGYTKSIEVCFDGAHKIMLRTNRPAAARAASARSDFTVVGG